MLKCVVIDDEPLAIQLLADHINRVSFLQLAGTFLNPLEGLISLNKSPVDLIFLDIQMPGLLGTTFIWTLNNPPKVIFTTAYRKFAIEGFELNAIDYLLKPVEPKRLADALHKLEYIEEKEALTSSLGVQGVNRGILGENDQVFVKDGERCWFVKLSDVRLFESVGNYAKVFFGTNKPLILKSLNALEERLDDKVFFRANRKHIINLRMIDKIEPYFNGGLLLDLTGGEKIEVSRRQAVKFKEMMSL